VVAGLPWPAKAIVTNSRVAIKSIVAHGDGIAILPKQLVAIERQVGLLHWVDLAEAGGTRALGLSCAKERPLSPLARRFAEIVRARDYGTETCSKSSGVSARTLVAPKCRRITRALASARGLIRLPILGCCFSLLRSTPSAG
jgi:hypothetical protein